MNQRPVFTTSQWQELEHQALIFKYLVAGIPVPPDLILPIRRSLESRMFHQPTVGWGPFFGKKVDPEPGRCRRTDGKKWRCSKDAYTDSKYCERHMHRGRNRSRKPVETQTVSQSSSTVTSLTAAGSSYPNFPLHSMSTSQDPNVVGIATSHMQVQPAGPYGTSNKECRYLSGSKDEIDEYSFFTEASGSSKSARMDSSIDNNAWNLMPSRVNSFPPSKYRNGSLLQSNYPQMPAVEDLGPATIAAALPKQQQYCFLGSSAIGPGDSYKMGREEPGVQPLRPFFDEWPRTRDSWSDLEEDRSNRTSFSTTQLSISIPMSSSDFSGTSSCSPNG